MSNNVLKVENATMQFGGVVAVDNLNLEINQGEIVALIGPNGAGKSTLFKSVSGFNTIDKGTITFEGKQIQNMEPYKISRMGIASTFQHAQMFPNLTLLEAVMAGAYGSGKGKAEAKKIAQEKIDFVELTGKENMLSSKLNMFERKRAELAAALATQPKLVLLDELFAGLVPSEVPEMIKLVRKVRDTGISVFIVEHVLRAIMEMSDNVYVLESGKLIAEGTPTEIASNPVVIQAYLGEDDGDITVSKKEEGKPESKKNLLTVKNLSAAYDAGNVLEDVSLEVNEGELVVVIGANGAGKSTLVRTIMGFNEKLKHRAGEVVFLGKHIEKMKSQNIVKEGLGMILEGRQLFPEMTVEEHLLMGAYTYKKDKAKIEENLKWVYNLFGYHLEPNKNRLASSFSGGQQQMITLGRGLMQRPKLLIIDEMSLGLAPLVIAELFELIKMLNDQGISILLIEQNARQALQIADRGYVLENGKITLTGIGEELLNNEQVKSAYLGL